MTSAKAAGASGTLVAIRCSQVRRDRLGVIRRLSSCIEKGWFPVRVKSTGYKVKGTFHDLVCKLADPRDAPAKANGTKRPLKERPKEIKLTES